MANSDKDILITPSTGSSTASPKIEFVGANSVGSDTITMQTLYDGTKTTLSFEGSAGDLFSIVNDLTTNPIFSVNNASGVSCIEVDNNGGTRLAEFSGNVGIGNSSPTQKLDVTGNILASGTLTATGGNSTNWNTAYGWGNHASAGYAPAADPTFTGDARLTEYLYHNGNVGTYLRYLTDRIILRAGSGAQIDFNSNGQLYMTGEINAYNDIDIVDDNLKMGGTTVIDSSRNITAGTITASGNAQVGGALKITEAGTAQNLLIGNQDSGGTNKPAMIMGVNGYLRFGHGSSWSGEGGTFTEKLRVDNDTDVISGNFQMGSTTVIDSSRNITAAGRITLNTNRTFTGLEPSSGSNGRAQVLLSSYYSDVVIASKQTNANHGSTISFTSANPADSSAYRKFVINQGNWGGTHLLRFGWRDGSYPNPHEYVGGSFGGTYDSLGINGQTKVVYAFGEMHAPIFKDYNNTAYYVDPNSTSNINSLVATTINRNPVVTLSGDVTGAATMTNLGSINITATVANNSHSHTNYLPLAGGRMTGVFNLDDQKIQFGSSTNSGSTFGNNHYSMGVDIANGGWSGTNYSDLIIGYHTGIRIGGGYSGVRFYNNSPTTDTNNTGNGNGGEALLMTIGGGGSTTSGANVTINNDLYMGDNIHINTGKGFDNSGSWTRNQTPHGYIEFGPANTTWAHIYTDRPNFYFNKDLYVNNQRVFHVGYHPNADKWTTARTNTVTLTGDVTGSGNASVDGTGNWTVSIPAVVANNSHSHSNYLTSNAADTATGKITFNAGFDGNSIFLNGAQNFDALKTSGFYSLYNATATGHTNAPFQYGAMISANNTAASGGMGMQLAHERTGAGTFIRGMNDSSDTWYAWQRIFMDNYHPNADKWTTLRTLFLTGDVTGSVNWDGSGNATMTTAVGNDSHSHAFNNLTAKTGGTGTYQTSGSFRAPIFYDSDNTGYYVNPNGTSRFNDLELEAADSHLKIGGTGYVTASDSNKPGIELGNGQAYPHLTLFSSGTNTNHGGVISFRSALTSGFRRWNIGTANYNPNVIGIGVYDNNDNPHYGLTSVGPSKWTLDNSGNSVAIGSHRAPIFYDSDNTNYYVNPASTGTSLKARGDIVADGNHGKGLVGLYSSTRLQNVFSMGTAFRLAADGTTSGNLYGMAWSHPNAGSIGGANNLNDHGLLIINNGVFKAAISSRAVFSADVRGTLFYDYNNTGYYLDPASTSYLNVAKSNKVEHHNGTSSNVQTYLSGSGNSGTKLYWRTDSAVDLMNVDLSGNFTANGRVYVAGSTTNFLGAGPYSATNLAINFGNALFLYSGSTNLVSFSTSNTRFNTRTILDPRTSLVSTTPNIQSLAQSDGNGVTQYHINFCNLSQAVHGRITSNNFSTTYATTSDYRVKEDVREMEAATERLLQLNPVNFKWKGSEIRTDGFLAHEVDAIVPEAVVGIKDATEEVTDDEGVTTTVDSLQALDQAKLVPLLIKTIQELEARIAALENA